MLTELFPSQAFSEAEKGTSSLHMGCWGCINPLPPCGSEFIHRSDVPQFPVLSGQGSAKETGDLWAEISSVIWMKGS